MSERVDYKTVVPEAYQAMAGLERQVRRSGLEPALLELVKLRASQLNGCGYCLDMHAKLARAQGVSEQRIYLLSTWQEAPCYSERERAALAWTEAVTLVAETRVPDEIYRQASSHFEEDELVNLTLAVVAINGWNRLQIAFRAEVGSYRLPDASGVSS